MDDKAHMVRHFLASLAYRFHKAVDGAPEGYPSLDAGHGIRPPRDIVHHINGVHTDHRTDNLLVVTPAVHFQISLFLKPANCLFEFFFYIGF